ncbi:FAD binding domain-containing protein [Diaporthe amygdali]|uniref:FAD binding domain-containing protein n=1 Tax=Phomopsis amygdali TaxID=1214568 RepID=UPI0022FE53A8|nr:FAD binding domain-containing protein [Diaporthe amygdali]KAJ0106895.1 FAD binding domain-containing protein [Diaporthe amygdali]
MKWTILGLLVHFVAAQGTGNPAVPYKERVESYWSASARLNPWCFVQPQTVGEVSLALTTLAAAGQGAGDWHIAIRGGGHSFPPGVNNIENGVTIDMGLFNQTTYNAGSGLASVGPGGHWTGAYTELARSNVTVVGGREGQVGIGGFLLGGGNSYYTFRQGFGCDNVVNFEVVLADGSLVNANSTSHHDLYRALKGGSSNFGIVTRFDLNTLPNTPLWGGIRTYDYNLYADVALESIADFANADESQGDNALIVLIVTSGDTTISLLTNQINTQGVTDAPSFAKLSSLPALTDSMQIATVGELTGSGGTPAGLRNVWFTSTFGADTDLLRTVKGLYEDFLADLWTLLPADTFETQIVFQPIPSYLAQAGERKGGNVLGLDSSLKKNAVLFLLTLKTKTAADEAVIHARGGVFFAKVGEAVKASGNSLPFVYLNYANPSQDPLGSYGAENIELIREVSAKYDPQGFFQRRVPGGFKISRVA